MVLLGLRCTEVGGKVEVFVIWAGLCWSWLSHRFMGCISFSSVQPHMFRLEKLLAFCHFFDRYIVIQSTRVFYLSSVTLREDSVLAIGVMCCHGSLL